MVVNVFCCRYCVNTKFTFKCRFGKYICPVLLDLNRTFRFIQSAHSFAMAFCVNSLRSFTSNSVPYIQSKVLAFAFSLASEIERQLISDRTRESLKRVKAEGKHIGRPRGSTYRKLAKKHNKIKELLDKHVSKAEIARLLGCDWNTLHRYIKESYSF